MTMNEHAARLGDEALEEPLLAWGTRQALSTERAAALRDIILAEAARSEASGQAAGAPWPEGWWARYAAELRVVLERSLNLEAALAACRPERLRAAVGPPATVYDVGQGVR